MTEDQVETNGLASLSSANLRVAVITGLDALEPLTPQWKWLVDATDHSSAFATPEAVLSWYRLIDRAAGVYVVSVWSGDKLVGLLPLSRTTLWPYRLFVNAGAEYKYPGDPLLGPDPMPVAHAIIDHLAGLISRGYCEIRLRMLRTDAALVRALDERTDVTAHSGGAHTRSLVRFDQIADPDGYFQQVARKHDVPRQLRRLRERFGDVDYVAADPEPDLALNSMRDMLARRFGSAPPIVSTPRREAFTRRLIHHLITAGHAQIFSMVAGGERIAVNLAMRVGPRVSGQVVAHEPDLRKYGLGSIELFSLLRTLHAEGAAELDLGPARFSYKNRWANAEESRQTITITAVNRQPDFRPRAFHLAVSYSARRFTRGEQHSLELN